MSEIKNKAVDPALVFIEGGADLAGGAVSSALGFMAAGPGGAVAAGVVGVALQRTLRYAASRYMSQRERIRSGAVSAHAIARISQRIGWGHQPREDFFSENLDCRSDGEEILEGVLIKARDEFEERKLKYLAFFYANLVFDSSVSAMTAHRLLKTIGLLSYRQLIFLALVHKEKMVDVSGLRSHSHHKSAELEALKIEEMDLLSGYIGLHGLIWNYRDYEDRLSNLGRVLARLAELDCIPAKDLEVVSTLLASCPEKSHPMYKPDLPADEDQ